jgi:hypothetical protein
MKTQFCAVLDADGLHDDGWCSPHTRVRIRSHKSARQLTLSVWIPEQAATHPVDFRVYLGRAGLFNRGRRFSVPPGQPTRLTVPAPLSDGDELSFGVSTRHRQKKSNGDARDLSFMLQGLALGGV